MFIDLARRGLLIAYVSWKADVMDNQFNALIGLIVSLVQSGYLTIKG